ncbi:MAG: HAMP domain-containing histidine kinase, partial [bacterium]|nr:HAMP domain-containing histidine kinase [bacterium]
VKTGWEMVERNVGRVSGMIMDMLYCARDRTPRRIEVPLARTVDEVKNLFLQRATDAGVMLESQLDPSLDNIIGEPKDIHALLTNLVTNAIDACAACPDETKAYRVTVRTRREGEDAVIEVEDNGTGMDEETRAKLFTMFFSTKGASGTGLGLLVSHKVAAEHGGSIQVASKPGAGTTFIVRLPQVRPEP